MTRTPPAHDLAGQLRGFGPIGLTAVVVILAGGLAGPLVSATLVLAWAQISETPLQALGFKAPRRWPVTLVVGVALGVVLKLGAKALVMPLLGAPAVNEHYHYLVGNAAALPGMVATVLISAGIGEEVFFRGYLFERLGRLWGHSRAALVATVLLSTALFAVAHYQDQRLPGVEQALVIGLVYGALFAWRRQIWLVIATHAAFDLTAVAIIYWDLETRVAHLLFR
jgi:membrane protease YdiL (CAAX protease family)